SAARTFFDRPAPGGYLAEWTEWLARSEESGGSDAGETPATSERDGVGVLIFRIGQEWLAFRTQAVAEVPPPRPPHPIPHPSAVVRLGLGNLRGELQLCIPLAGLLGVESTQGVHPSSSPQARSDAKATVIAADSQGEPGERSAAAPGARLVVLRDRDRAETWV